MLFSRLDSLVGKRLEGFKRAKVFCVRSSLNGNALGRRLAFLVDMALVELYQEHCFYGVTHIEEMSGYYDGQTFLRIETPTETSSPQPLDLNTASELFEGGLYLRSVIVVHDLDFFSDRFFLKRESLKEWLAQNPDQKNHSVRERLFVVGPGVFDPVALDQFGLTSEEEIRRQAYTNLTNGLSELELDILRDGLCAVHSAVEPLPSPEYEPTE